MESDELYDYTQEVKTAFVITLLIAIYCFSVIIKSLAVHLEWKVIWSSVGFVIVSVIDTGLFIHLLDLKEESKKTVKDSE
jgi:multidrug transporter EmrE-like cation transporter